MNFTIAGLDYFPEQITQMRKVEKLRSCQYLIKLDTDEEIEVDEYTYCLLADYLMGDTNGSN